MKHYIIEKEKIRDLVGFLKHKYRVVGPKIKENQFIIDDIDSPDELTLLYRPSILSLKKFYLPQQENLLDFSLGETISIPSDVSMNPIAIFGAHTCDIAGITCLDNACGQEPRDKNFFKRKKNILIIGIECTKPCDDYATCVTVGTHNPKGGYDVMLTDIGSGYLVQTNSEEGEDLIHKSNHVKEADTNIVSKVSQMRVEKDQKFPRKIVPKGEEIKGIMEKTAKSPVWDDVGARCVACGNCTNVCPTCYCFDIKDDVDLALENGVRYRIWDSCQLKSFAEVAGGENFRKNRKDRQRHRYFRKFNYCMEKYGRHFCVGCGRCTRTCMAKISLIETVNSLAKEKV